MQLRAMDVIVTCQGGDYTKQVYADLRGSGWDGYWIDAASKLRMADDSVIVLDPVNRDVIDRRWTTASRDFIGGNCTVSLMMMAMGGLFEHDLIEWISVMTYQAASGGGARHMRELLAGMGSLHASVADLLADPASAILDIDRRGHRTHARRRLPRRPVRRAAGRQPDSVDRCASSTTVRAREEWKGGVEANKILGLAEGSIPIDGLCVRVGAMRCHSQALTVKLKRDLPLDEVRRICWPPATTGCR